jgi:hypothetical protein
VDELWSAQVHDESGRYVAAGLYRQADGVLELQVGGTGWRAVTIDVDDARSLFAALGGALQDTAR